MKDSEKLRKKVESEFDRITDAFGGESYWAIHNIIRRIDFIFPLYRTDDPKQKKIVEELRTFYSYGWGVLLKKYYKDVDITKSQPFTLMTSELVSWCDSNIIYSGKLSFCKQLIEYEKSKLIKISETKENEFVFDYNHKHNGLERFDKESLNFYVNNIVEKIILERQKIKSFDENEIRKELKRIISSPDGKMIVYHSTPLLDEYYNQRGHFHMLRSQGYDDFDKKDIFGDIEYWRYIDLIEIIMGTSIMRLEACLELVKSNPNIDLHNILSYTCFQDKEIKMYAHYLSMSVHEISQILSCVTLTKDNYNYYLDYPSAPPPMYFEVGNNLFVKSIAGVLTNPVLLLNKELKRRYKKDYDKSVNNREDRFRRELFEFFPDERIIKIPRGVNIFFQGIKTDIDAIVYDTKTKNLGLFQLKWQDPYGYSMKERYSRISNLFDKANEWVDKMKYWVLNNDAKTIINSLQINKKNMKFSEINEVKIFVLSRNQMNFTGVELNDTVAWSSWHQLIESQASVELSLDDPITEMFVKTKALEPKRRVEYGEVDKIEPFTMEFKDFNVSYNN
ncbi:hypothetical protein [uncultured Algibacter sp.]|uniref:hypothetical protein n=1 Tax=uncultured Algibacter sp. TaxID=298659 RepID=UPI0030ECB90E|tara:strand:+ start:10388 stop:12073 length:1686 start_codon:yes stop_codon:yes gene_type:complete